MTTSYPLLSRIAKPENLQAAWLRVRGKGASGGLDGVTPKDLAGKSDEWLFELRQALVEERYTPEPLLRLTVPKPSKPREKRMLGLPSVRDKVAQEAARRVIEPILNREFCDCSYGYRRGKGPQKAVRRVLHLIRNRKCTWVATADIDDFFGSVDHDLLIHRLSESLGDSAVVRLLELWLRMGTVDPKGRWRDVYSGVGQGGVISPLLANFYLHPFDRFVTGQGDRFNLVRYSDDFVILTRSRTLAETALEKAKQFLQKELRLGLNPNERPVVAVGEGFTFLGIRFSGDRLGLDPDKEERIRNKIHDRCSRLGTEPVEKTVRTINESLAGWHRYYGPLLPADEINRIRAMVLDALVRPISRCFDRKMFRSNRQALQALEGIDLPGTLDPKARRTLLTRVIRNGRAAQRVRHQRPAEGPTTGRASPRARRATKRRTDPPRPETVKPRRTRSPAATVRQRKRRHLREQASRVELTLTTPGTFLGKSGDRLVVRRERRIVHELPVVAVRSVTIAHHGVSLSADVIGLCAARSIPIVVIALPGRVQAVVSQPGAERAQVSLLQVQTLQDPARCFTLARAFVLGKVRNQRNYALYLGKYHRKATPSFREALGLLLETGEKIVDEVRRAGRPDDGEFRGRLLSTEGRYAALYWQVFGAVLGEKAAFPGRKRRGAKDLVNSLLNYGYAILESRVYLALVKAGLNPQVSFLHALQEKKPVLCYDLMEEFRPQVVDRTVASLVTRRQPVTVDDEGRLTVETRRLLIRRVHERLASVIRFRGRELKLDEIIQHQADLLVQHLREKARYRPFVAKW